MMQSDGKLPDDPSGLCQVVRELVESAYPRCRVTKVEGALRAEWGRTPHGNDYVLVGVREDFIVYTAALDPWKSSVKCHIKRTADDQLMIEQTEYRVGFGDDT